MTGGLHRTVVYCAALHLRHLAALLLWAALRCAAATCCRALRGRGRGRAADKRYAGCAHGGDGAQPGAQQARAPAGLGWVRCGVLVGECRCGWGLVWCSAALHCAQL